MHLARRTLFFREKFVKICFGSCVLFPKFKFSELIFLLLFSFVIFCNYDRRPSSRSENGHLAAWSGAD